MSRREPNRARYTFFAAYGFGPYECFFCREPTVPFHSVWVHHIDENEGNDHPLNLTASHPPCHNGFHHKGKGANKGIPKSPEHRAKLSAALRGRSLPPEQRAKIGAALRGRRASLESRLRRNAEARETMAWAFSASGR